jgi:threonine dehydrogenase-like Zn-dependent dehydrogenase
MPPRPGAFAGFVAIPERNVHPVSDRLDTARAALCEPLAVAWHAVRIGFGKLGAPPAGARVAMLGGGAIGLAAALVARHLGAAVTVAETNPARRALIADTEGIPAFDPREGDGPAEGADLIVDAVGAAATRALSSRAVRPGGAIVHAGLLPGGEGFDIRRITLQEITVTGTYCYTPDDFCKTLAAMEAGALGRLAWFETRPLAEGATAFAALDAGTVAAPKIVLIP